MIGDLHIFLVDLTLEVTVGPFTVRFGFQTAESPV
jgi:hypothetical protein